MANKKLFPNAQALPPKAPKIKGGKWRKSPAPALAVDETTTAAAEPTTAEPVVEPMPAVEASKTKPKAKKTPKPKAPAKSRKEGMSMTEAAKKVLADKGEAMTCKDMIDVMAAKGYWKSAKGLTPANTLYSSILRLIQRDGRGAAFKKTDRGTFAINPSAQT